MALLQQKIVTIGAGTGQANLLQVLRRHYANITAIVGVTDNGGHSGLLRQQFGIPQVGDGRQVLVALANNPEMAELFDHRFSSDDQTLNGASLGNFILASLCQQEGSIAAAFAAASKLLGCHGTTLPFSTVSTDISAVLADGSKIVGEWQIMDRSPRLPILDLFLEPAAPAYEGSVKAVKGADWVIIGPGSLLTGIIPTFLATGMAEAIQQTHAKLIYVSNLMTQPGQTDGFSVKDHILTLQKYAGRAPDFVVANKAAVDPVIMEHYKTIGSRPILDGHNLDNLPCRIIQADLVPSTDGMPIQERIGQFKKWTHLLVHNAAKLADILSSIIV